MEYFIHLAILCGIFAILALSLNLIVGYTGLLSIGLAAFYGIGAYANAILQTRYHWNFFAAMVAGVFVCALLALIVGFVFSRLDGDYYALSTLGFSVIVFSVLLNWQSLTRGPLGIPGIPRPELGGIVLSSNARYLLLVAVIFALVYFFCVYISRSSYGRVLKGIREDERALQVFGYQTLRYKLSIFVIGAALASVGGALYASYITFIDPSSFGVMESVFVIAMIILGGLANLRGSILGAIIFILLPEALRFVGLPSEIAAQMRQVIYGVLLILLMLYRPQGLLGEYKL